MNGMSLRDHGFPPAGEIFSIEAMSLGVLPGEHPWLVAHRADIEANWQREIAANPKLFDGGMVLQRRLRFEGGHILGEAHLTPYSAFLHWRRHERKHGALHLFAMPLTLSSDGALIAVRMGADTANPGRIYCAAGSMDASDIVDGKCDFEYNMQREVTEETGLDLSHAQAEPGYHAFHDHNTVVVFRRYRFALTADEMAEKIAEHVRREAEPEIDGAVVIRDSTSGTHDYPFFMPAIVAWLFD